MAGTAAGLADGRGRHRLDPLVVGPQATDADDDAEHERAVHDDSLEIDTDRDEGRHRGSVHHSHTRNTDAATPTPTLPYMAE